MVDFARLHVPVVDRLILSKPTRFSENPMALFGQSNHVAGFLVRLRDGLFLDKSLRSKFTQIVVHGSFVTAVSKPGQVTHVHGAESADIGHRHDLSMSQRVSSVLVPMACPMPGRPLWEADFLACGAFPPRCWTKHRWALAQRKRCLPLSRLEAWGAWMPALLRARDPGGECPTVPCATASPRQTAATVPTRPLAFDCRSARVFCPYP